MYDDEEDGEEETLLLQGVGKARREAGGRLGGERHIKAGRQVARGSQQQGTRGDEKTWAFSRLRALPPVAVGATRGRRAHGLDRGRLGRVVGADGRSVRGVVVAGRAVRVVADERARRAGRGRGRCGRRRVIVRHRLLVAGRAHGRDRRELGVAGLTRTARAGEADGESRDELATAGGDDEPHHRRDGEVRVRVVVVDPLAGSEEEAERELRYESEGQRLERLEERRVETHAEEDDGRDEGKERRERREDAHDEVGAQGKQEGDGGQARADGREDERLGQAADNGVAGAVEAGGSAEEVLVTVHGGEESVGVPWERTDRAPSQVEKAAREDSLAERRRRAAVRGAHSPVAPSGGHAVDVPLEVADVVPDRCGNLQRRARSEPGQGRSRRPGKAWGETHRDNDQERHRSEEQERSEPVNNVEPHSVDEVEGEVEV